MGIVQKRLYKNLTCFNKAADWSSDEHRAITRSALRRSFDSYRWTSSSKKSKPEDALTSRKCRYCTVVKLTILCEITSNRTASFFFFFFFFRKAPPQEPVNKKSERFFFCFFLINNFLYFFERDIRWMRKIKTVTRSNGTAIFFQTAYHFPPIFLIGATAVLRNRILNFFFVFYCISSPLLHSPHQASISVTRQD